MTAHDDDAFQRIVDGYGDVPSVEDVEAEVRREATARVEGRDATGAESSPRSTADREPDPELSTEPESQAGSPAGSQEHPEPTAWNPTPWEDEGRFVPPPIPPAPPTTWQRLMAWTGLIAPPLIVLLATVLSWTIPTLVGYALIASAVGGFGYLVRTMPNGPRDPGDDGARV